MLPEIVALIEKHYLLFAVFLVGGLVGIAFEQLDAKLRRKAWRENSRWRWGKKRTEDSQSNGPWPPKFDAKQPNRPDAADQLRIVMGASFSIQPLLNKGEVRVYKELDRILTSVNPGWKVMAQVSMDEILRSKDVEAYNCINSKRVDLLLIDGDCQPLHAIEYQGGGHYQGTAAARDAVKKEALRRAGIGYHEVVADHTTPNDLRRLIEKIVDRATAG